MEAVRLMKSRAGRNTYTNSSRRKYFFGHPGEGDDGYSDCSSAVRECIRRASGIYIGSNTDAQIRNYKKGVLVENTSNIFPDESLLRPGDCLYFKGNKNHVKQVGHVEMYTGPNECWGHGSGTGPTRKDLRKYCENRARNGRRYFCAIRWIPEDREPEKEITPEGHVYMTVREGVWPVRSRPAKSGGRTGTAKEGERVRVYGERDGWYGVRKADGCKGYVEKAAFV